MKLKDYFLIALVAWGLIMTYTTVDNSEAAEHYRIEKEREQAAFKHREDSLVKVTHRNDEKLLKAFRDIREAEILRDIANEKAADYKSKYENIKIRTHSTDLERADAIKRLYPN